MRRVLIPAVLVCIAFASSVDAQDEPSGISFEKVTAEATGIKTVMEEWKAEELARQGGKWQSHGWWPWGLTSFDYDRDGDLDLVASHHGKPGCVILRSMLKETGKLTFMNATSDLGITARDLPIADGKPWIWDFDGDGWLDIAGWSDEHKTPSFLNQGGKKFTKIPKFTFNPISHAGEVKHINNDGWPDLAARHRGMTYAFTFDPEKRTFIKIRKLTPRPSGIPAHITDYFAELKKKKKNRFFHARYRLEHDLNGDGLNDLVASGAGAYGGDTLGRYYITDANGNYFDKTAELGLPTEGTPILVRDITGDGAPEIIIAVGDQAGLYVNNGKGKFTRKRNALSKFLKTRDPYTQRVTCVDLDFDGDLDLVVSSPRLQKEEVYENLGGGDLIRVLSARGWDSDPIVIADINGDGLLDVAIGGPGGHKSTEITIYLNTTKNPGNSCRVLARMPAPNPYAVGAVIEAFKAGELGKPRAKPFLSQKANPDSSPVYVALGRAKSFDLRVTFPNGETVEMKGVTDKEVTVRPKDEPK